MTTVARSASPPLLARLRRDLRRRRVDAAALRVVASFCSTHNAQARICWDLDNTLVESGRLIRAGLSLERAIVEAYPVPNMLDLYAGVREAIPDAAHFILTARGPGMKRDTIAWCSRHCIATEAALALVPAAESKPAVWRRLAADAKLVIVDDLTFNHELDTPAVYEQLVAEARRAAVKYVGFHEISAIAAGSAAVTEFVTEITIALAAGAPVL